MAEGLWRATVERIDANGAVYVSIPGLSPGQIYGPLEGYTDASAGDRVLVGFIGGRSYEPAIVRRPAAAAVGADYVTLGAFGSPVTVGAGDTVNLSDLDNFFPTLGMPSWARFEDPTADYPTKVLRVTQPGLYRLSYMLRLSGGSEGGLIYIEHALVATTPTDDPEYPHLYAEHAIPTAAATAAEGSWTASGHDVWHLSAGWGISIGGPYNPGPGSVDLINAQFQLVKLS